MIDHIGALNAQADAHVAALRAAAAAAHARLRSGLLRSAPAPALPPVLVREVDPIFATREFVVPPVLLDPES